MISNQGGLVKSIRGPFRVVTRSESSIQTGGSLRSSLSLTSAIKINL